MKQGWEKQYRYKVGKKKEYLTSSAATRGNTSFPPCRSKVYVTPSGPVI